MGKVLSNSERILFCEQMGMILKSGISAAEGIMIMKEDAGQEESPLRELYEEIQRNLDETGIFYDALEETGAFPDYMIQMARIGEQTGNLDEVMEGLAAYYEREENMVQDIKSAVTYPLLMLGMMLVIHMDPVEMQNEHIMQMRRQVEETLAQIDDKCSIHDFRAVNGENQINLIFDMVVPFGYTEEQKAELQKKLTERLREADCRYHCVIMMEHSYVS